MQRATAASLGGESIKKKKGREKTWDCSATLDEMLYRRVPNDTFLFRNTRVCAEHTSA